LIVHRRDTKNAKGRSIFLSGDPPEGAADRKDRKEKNTMPTGNSDYRIVMDINELSSKIIVAATAVHFLKKVIAFRALNGKQ